MRARGMSQRCDGTYRSAAPHDMAPQRSEGGSKRHHVVRDNVMASWFHVTTESRLPEEPLPAVQLRPSHSRPLLYLMVDLASQPFGEEFGICER